MEFYTEKHIEDFDEDKFGYKVLSKRILDNILLKMKLPNCFGFYGNWGSGKSTILHFIEKHLQEDPNENYGKITSVYFEPWKYEYSEQSDLLFALLNCIKDQSRASGQNIENIWKRILVDIAAINSGVLRAAQLADMQKTIADVNFLENELFPAHEIWVDKVEGFKSEFQQVVGKVLKKNKTSKIFIFIDDLDRCLPENAVKLVEGIKNFLSVPNVLFVLAIDRRIIGEMIEKKYGLHHGYGDEYLMKIIHYYFVLPVVDLETTVMEILSNYEISFTQRQIAYIVEFLRYEGKEPRIAKQFLHQFGMNVLLSDMARKKLMEDESHKKLQYAFVATFLISTFPELFTHGRFSQVLKNVSESASALFRGDPKDSYQTITNSENITFENRKRLEAIMRLPINGEGDGNPSKIMDTNGLSEMILIDRKSVV